MCFDAMNNKLKSHKISMVKSVLPCTFSDSSVLELNAGVTD